MSLPTTIPAFEQGRVSTYEALISDAQLARFNAGTAVTAAKQQRSAAEEEVKKNVELRASLLKELSKIELPADATPLLAALEEALIALRLWQSKYLIADDALTVALGQQARADKTLSRAEAGVAEVGAALVGAQRQNDEHSPWKQRLADTDFQSAVSEAKTQYTPTPGNFPGFTAAKDRVEGDIPAALLVRARERQTAALAAATTRQGALDTALSSRKAEIATNGGRAGTAWQRGEVFLEQRAKLRDQALIVEQIEQLKALLVAIATSPELTTAEHDRLVALTTDGAVAAGKEKDFEDGTITANDFEPFKPALDKWEAAVPEHIWKNLHDFDSVVRALDAIAAFDPVTALNDFEEAEKNYAEALQLAFEHELTVADYHESLLELAPAAHSAAAPERILSALRGDG